MKHCCNYGKGILIICWKYTVILCVKNIACYPSSSLQYVQQFFVKNFKVNCSALLLKFLIYIFKPLKSQIHATPENCTPKLL